MEGRPTQFEVEAAGDVEYSREKYFSAIMGANYLCAECGGNANVYITPPHAVPIRPYDNWWKFGLKCRACHLGILLRFSSRPPVGLAISELGKASLKLKKPTRFKMFIRNTKAAWHDLSYAVRRLFGLLHPWEED